MKIYIPAQGIRQKEHTKENRSFFFIFAIYQILLSDLYL